MHRRAGRNADTFVLNGAESDPARCGELVASTDRDAYAASDREPLANRHALAITLVRSADTACGGPWNSPCRPGTRGISADDAVQDAADPDIDARFGLHLWQRHVSAHLRR